MAGSVDGATEQLPRTAAVVVIGGGVNGASTAFWLAKRGVHDVVLLEQRHLGAGASGKSGALVRCHYTNPHEARLTRLSHDVFANWGDVIGYGDPVFETPGFLKVVAPEDEGHLRANVAMLQSIGVETELVAAADIPAIEPLVRTDDLTCAAYEPNGGFADPNATLYGFALGLSSLGGRIYAQTTATAIQTDGDRVVGVETNRGVIATEAVVYAGGAWSDRLLATVGVDLDLTPIRAEVVVFRRPAQVEERDRHRRHCVVIDSTQHSWIRPVGDAGTLIGVETPDRQTNPDGFRESPDPAYIDVARQALSARFPDYAQATMRGGWAGVFMNSADGRPIIDQIPSVPGLWVMTGDSGTSFKTSPAIGQCLAEWVTEGAPQLMDLHPFRSTRFAEGQPWVDEHEYAVGDEALTISR